jgi:two-component system, cell cycle sensor histidine kinase and response regulator CckA
LKDHLPNQRIPWFLITIFMSLLLGVLIIGLLYYQKQQERIKTETQNDLEAIADLKTTQIDQWRKERIIDATLIYNNVSIARQVDLFLKTPANARNKQDLLKLMKSFQKYAGYKSILLLDAKRNIRLSVSNHDDSVCSNGRTIFKEALLHRQVTFSDLHQSIGVPYVHIDLMVPLLSPDRSDSMVIGMFILRIDPNNALFPLIQSWPTPSRTSETLLLEQDGDSIVYLNELRHRKNTTLTLRLPISNEQLPASMAVRGIKGVVEGIDYRGVSVLAAIRSIPDSPWFLNAKVDQEEIYAPLRSQSQIAAVVMLLVILSTGGIIGSWWRHQRSKFYRDKYLAELDRQALLKHYDYVIKYANDGILLINMDGKIIEANDQACRMYGYSREELCGLYEREIRPLKLRHLNEGQIKQGENQGGLLFETEHLRRDGTVFPVEVSSRFIKIDESRFYQSIVRDITERKRVERSIQESEVRFRRIFEEGPFGMVITGLDFHFTEANTAFCKMMGYSESEIISLTFRDITHPEDVSSSAEAMRQLSHGEIPIFKTEKRYMRKNGGVVWGSLTVTLVRNKNGQFLYYLAMVEDITERKQTEEALHKSEAMLNESQRVAAVGHYILDAKTGCWTCSKALDEIFGIDEAYGKNVEGWVHIIHPDHRDEMSTYLKEHVLRERNLFNKEYKIVRISDHAERWMHGLGKLEFDAQGNPVKMFGTIQDVTERKRAEESLRESEERFRRLVGSVTDYTYSVKLESGRPVATIHAPACISVTGYTSEEYTANPDLWHRMIYDEDKQIVTNHTEKILSGFDVLPLEHRIIHKNGSPRWVKNTIVVKRDDKGSLIAYDGLIEDITMQKQTDEVLRESEETAYALLNAPSDAAYLLNNQRRIIAVNDAGAKGFGKSFEKLIGVCVDDLFPPAIAHARKLFIDQVIRSCKPVHFEDEHMKMHLENSFYPITDTQGNVTRIAVFSRDITERIRTEEALRQSESLFKMLVESSPVAIAVFSGPSKKLEYVSNRFTGLFGYSKEDIPSMDAWWPLAYPVQEYCNQIQTKWCEIVAKGVHEESEIEPLESVVTCQDGSTKYIDSTYISVGEDTLVFFVDLTQHRLAQEALRQTHSFNDLLIQTMPFGMDIVDEEGKILFMSKVMRDMLGKDATDSCCWNAYKDDKQQCLECPLRRGIMFGKPETIETAGVFGGKTYQISHVGMLYEGKKAMLEVFQDITEQKRLQQELVQSQKLLSIGTMAGGIAHDFNNILAIILGYSSILHSIKDNPQKFSDGVSAIKHAVDRGAGLVRQILTFARKTDISFEPLSMSDLVLELVSMLQQTFPKIITLNTNIPKNLPYINADHTQMHQAVLNLCVNARDAMSQGGEISIVLEKVAGELLRERFPSAENFSYLCLSVSDTGMGMDEATRNQIFDPFFTTKEKGKGTGLGLSVVYGIMHAHHGFIDVHSAPGKGTTFYLYFPIPQESGNPLATQIQEEKQISGGNETILFVEDETLLVDMVQILLESNGYTVLTAKDGEEAVSLYRQHVHEIALVISDMGLPKLTGMSEFEKMKEINPNVKIIFASGFFEPDMRATLENAGAKGFLQKPYVIEEMLSKVRNTIDGK